MCTWADKYGSTFAKLSTYRTKNVTIQTCYVHFSRRREQQFLKVAAGAVKKRFTQA